jgi:hypothetical protein
MPELSRRDFGQPNHAEPAGLDGIHRVRIGLAPYSFHDFPQGEAM